MAEHEAAEKPGYHHGDLRTALIEASLALIEEGGVQALSLRQAAKRAGVSAAAPYHHFPNRGALLAAIATDGFRLLGAEMNDAVRDAAIGAPRLTACGGAYVRFARKHPAHFRVMFRPELADPEAFPELHAASEPVFQTLVTNIAAGQANGFVPQGPLHAYVLLAWSVTHGLSALIVDGPLGAGFDKVDYSVDEMGDVVVDMFAQVLMAAAKAHRDASE
ncbi:MAG: TetR/AcrR family transcriptional regulator [Sandaracinaceae bacterium]